MISMQSRRFKGLAQAPRRRANGVRRAGDFATAFKLRFGETPQECRTPHG
jgi:hypothetical protein